MQSSLLCVCSYSLRMDTDTLSIKKMEGGGGRWKRKRPRRIGCRPKTLHQTLATRYASAERSRSSCEREGGRRKKKKSSPIHIKRVSLPSSFESSALAKGPAGNERPWRGSLTSSSSMADSNATPSEKKKPSTKDRTSTYSN